MIDVLEPFRATARAMDDEEMAVRREANARIAQLERARAHAYRRLDFVQALDEAARSVETPAAAIEVQRQHVLDRFGWPAFDSDPRRAIAEAVLPVLTALAALRHPTESVEGADRAPVPPPLAETLTHFETWYDETFGSSFWTLSDHFFPDTPLVDF